MPLQTRTLSDDRVLLKVRAATVNRTDCAYRGGENVGARLGFSLVTNGGPYVPTDGWENAFWVL